MLGEPWQLREVDTGVPDAIARDLLLNLKRSTAAAGDNRELQREHLLRFGAMMEIARFRARGIEISFKAARGIARRRLEKRSAAVARDVFGFGELVLAVASLRFDFQRRYPTDALAEPGVAKAARA